MATDKTPLTESLESLQAAYGLESHAKLAKTDKDSSAEALVDYEPLKLSSFRVCCAGKATILKDPILFAEQILITIIFFSVALPVYFTFKSDDIFESRKGDISVRRWLSRQEPLMRAFAMIMTTLAAFLLSFYTSICVARWWTMRAAGVGGIKAATLDLEWLLYQNVTKDEEILSAVRRYGRTSLLLIFLWRQNKLGELKANLVSQELLHEDEASKLLMWNHCLHETIWAWQSGIVTMLYKQGKVKSEQLFTLLLERCIEGRAAVQLVHTHLAVRVPMQYVHLLGLLVKSHNLVIAVIMGALFGAALRTRDTIIAIQLFARTLILPFLFNAILLMNVELTDPFDGSETDFPGTIYQAALDKDCKGFMSATQNLPDWLAARSQQADP
jgi:hypothetical protein